MDRIQSGTIEAGPIPLPRGHGEPQHNNNVSADNSERGIKLNDLLRVVRRRTRLVAVSFIFIFSINGILVIRNRITNPIYQGSFTLLIQDPVSTGSQVGGGGPDLMGAATNFSALANRSIGVNLPTLIEFLRSPLTLTELADEYNTTSTRLASRIGIDAGQGSRGPAPGILRVSLKGSNFLEDKRLLGSLSEIYLRSALLQRQKKLNEGIRFLDKQAPKLKEEESIAQTQLAEFRRKNSVIDPISEAEGTQISLIETNSSLAALEAEKARLYGIKSLIKQQKISASEFLAIISDASQQQYSSDKSTTTTSNQAELNSPALNEFIKKEAELETLRLKFKDNAYIIQTKRAALDRLQPLLRESQLREIEDQIQRIGSLQLEVNQRREQFRSQFKRYPTLLREYEELMRKLTVAETNLAGLRAARDSFRLQLVQTEVPWQILSPPTMDPNPVEPKLPLEFGKGAALALFCGMTAAFIRDRMDHVFHHPGEVKEEVQAPLLGHIPHVTAFQGVREGNRFLLKDIDNFDDTHKSDNKTSKGYERFFYQEAFRNLFTSIRFLSSDNKIRSIALTSSLPAEGKSLINILLAKTLSEMGQKVLLVDADLRKPQIHHRLGINNLTGLANLLTDKSLNWKDAINHVDGFEGWSVITAGRRPPDPTRLLSSDRMHQFVSEAVGSSEFDLVIFDTPPVLGLADAALVAEHCDGLILLISLNRVDRNLPKESIQRIRSSGSPLLGVVTNAIKESKTKTNAYGYGGYGYGGYGYGGYGYGGYGYGGYGYAAYDTTASYSYYNNEEEAKVDNPEIAEATSQNQIKSLASSISQGFRTYLTRKIGRFARWLDS